MFSAWAAIALLLSSADAYAACLDPDDLNAYWYPSVEEELASAAAVVIGTVIDVVAVPDEKPDFISAYLYTIHIEETLHGDVPDQITVRSLNDSGRYWMNDGETHLLFLNRRDSFFSASPCGNSGIADEAQNVLRELHDLLAGQ